MLHFQWYRWIQYIKLALEAKKKDFVDLVYGVLPGRGEIVQIADKVELNSIFFFGFFFVVLDSLFEQNYRLAPPVIIQRRTYASSSEK